MSCIQRTGWTRFCGPQACADVAPPHVPAEGGCHSAFAVAYCSFRTDNPDVGLQSLLGDVHIARAALPACLGTLCHRSKPFDHFLLC